jgi:hypothetical protein
MPSVHFSVDGFAMVAAVRRPRSPLNTVVSALAVGLVLLSGGRAMAGLLNIGSVNTFATGSSAGNPAGTWTLGDKDFTYLSSTGTWTGVEDIQLTTNFNLSIHSSQFLVTNLGSYNSPQTLTIGYQVHINGSLGPGWMFQDARMSETVSGARVDVWQDIYGSLAAFNANTAPGSGTLMTHQSTDGSLPPAGVFPSGLIDIWVRNTVTLSDPGGSLSSMGDTFRQQLVPEIDPNSCASVLALVMGSLGLLERRARRVRYICTG